MKQQTVFFHIKAPLTDPFYPIHICSAGGAYLSAAEFSAYISIIYSNITFYNTTLEKNLQVIFNIFYTIFAPSEDMTEARGKAKIISRKNKTAPYENTKPFFCI